MERERANLWGGAGKPVAVDEHRERRQRRRRAINSIGNVWEWTSGDFGAGAYHRRGLTLATPMKSIRGGAFDTYFDNQATCQFQSGENPVHRKHNIGLPLRRERLRPGGARPPACVPRMPHRLMPRRPLA